MNPRDDVGRDELSGGGYAAIAILISFPLHLAWEWSQCQPFFVHLATPATAGSMLNATLGDLLLTLVAYWIVSAVHGTSWLQRPWSLKTLATLEVVAITIAVGVESYAVATGRWRYTDVAPRLPFTDLAALPILQLAIILPASFLSARLAGRGLMRCKRDRAQARRRD